MIKIFAIASLSILLLSLFLTVGRLIRSGDLHDKVISLNLVGIIFLGIILAFMFVADDPVYLDVGLATILIVFAGTVMIARYIIRKTRND